MARPARHEPRAGQGRDPLPPRRDEPRGDGARRRDDGEVRRGRHPLRRRQGRRPGRPDRPVAGRARAGVPALRLRHRPAARSRPGHPGARRQHRRARHVVGDGHHLHARGPLGHRGGHRQAAPARRQLRPRRGHLHGRDHLHQGRLRPARDRPRRRPRRRPGVREGGGAARLPPQLARPAGRRRRRRPRGGLQPGRPRPGGALGARRPQRHRRRVPCRRPDRS